MVNPLLAIVLKKILSSAIDSIKVKNNKLEISILDKTFKVGLSEIVEFAKKNKCLDKLKSVFKKHNIEIDESMTKEPTTKGDYQSSTSQQHQRRH